MILSVSTSTPPVLQWQTWTDHAPGLSAPLPVGNSTPRDLLAPLAPPHVADITPPTRHDIIIPPIVEEPLPIWYRRRWVQASVAAGVLAAVVGAVLWAERTKSHPLDGPGMSSFKDPP